MGLPRRQTRHVPPLGIRGDMPTRMLVEKAGAVDASRIDDPVGQLSAAEQWAVEAALLTVLDLT